MNKINSFAITVLIGLGIAVMQPDVFAASFRTETVARAASLTEKDYTTATGLQLTYAGAPMLGFLGTVVGMVQAFYAIASEGNSANIATFSSGIYTALVTTVAGLVVGVIALFAYNYLVARINSVMNMLESKSMEFMDLLNEPAV